MKCPQCGAELSDSATFCSQCGTPIRPASFSYLPTGAPPWPGTVPQDYLYGAAATMEAAKKVEAAATGAPASKPRRSVGSVLLIIGLLILSVVIGVGGTLGILAANGQFPVPSQHGRQVQLPTPVPTASTGTPGATPATTPQSNTLPTPNSFQLTTIAQVGVSLKYPTGWIQDPPQLSTSGNSSVSFHPQTQLPVAFTVARLSAQNSASVSSADQVNQVNLQSLSTDANFHNYQEIPPANASPTIGGIQWVERDATFANGNNDIFHVVIASVKHNNLYYSITYFAPSTAYNEAVQKYYAQMLSSFHFTA